MAFIRSIFPALDFEMVTEAYVKEELSSHWSDLEHLSILVPDIFKSVSYSCNLPLTSLFPYFSLTFVIHILIKKKWQKKGDFESSIAVYSRPIFANLKVDFSMKHLLRQMYIELGTSWNCVLATLLLLNLGITFYVSNDLIMKFALEYHSRQCLIKQQVKVKTTKFSS